MGPRGRRVKYTDHERDVFAAGLEPDGNSKIPPGALSAPNVEPHNVYAQGYHLTPEPNTLAKGPK